MDGDVGQLAFIGDEPDVGITGDAPVFLFQDIITGYGIVQFRCQGLMGPGHGKGRLFDGDDIRQVLPTGLTDRY